MAFLTTDAVNELKSQVNIVDVISQYVALSRNGRNYLGLCPFHGEKTPSFSVNAEKGFYHCFGCGKSGDVIEFLKDYHSIGFVDAVKELAGFAGIALDLDAQEQRRDDPNEKLYEINNQAARLYHILLMSTELGEKAREYLAKRGITTEIIKQFNIGLAPDDEDFIYKNLVSKFDEGILANSGLFHFSNQRTFDAFTNRIMFPIRNEFGHVIGFSGRKWQKDDLSKAKYINTTTTAIFDKSYELWNFDRAKASISKSKEVYLMEGFMDVIAASQAGITNVVASMGTALTQKHVRRLKQQVKKFVLVYDGDAAGQNAIYKALNLIDESAVQIVKVPEGLDPDEYSKQYGLTELSNLMKNGRVQPLEFLMDFLRPENLSNLQVELDFIEQMAPKIARIPSITAQDAFIRKLVEILPDFEYNQVEQAINLRRENVAAPVNLQQSENVPPPEFFGDEANFPEAPFDERQFAIFDQTVKKNQPFPDTLAKQKLSKVERAEEQLLNRMIDHSAVLERFSRDENFRFVHQRYQNLFEKMLIEVMTFEDLDRSHFASELETEDKSLFYQILSLDLPEEVTSQEIDDLLANFAQEALLVRLNELIQQLENAQKAGNKERELELTVQIINQKKKLSN